MVIRENVAEYMKELKAWLDQTKDVRLEEMDAFFTERIDGYEEHMAVWERAYQRFALLLPGQCREILDLGCGTGLELGEIWKVNPQVTVTGVDLCKTMLDKLVSQYQDRPFQAVCADYFQYDMGEGRWDAVISFESLHHFFPEKKKGLYEKIHRSLKEEGVFLLGDYIACCQEEEELLRKVYLEKRGKYSEDGRGCGEANAEIISADGYVHFDMPLTLEHEMELLKEAGFARVFAVDCVDGATMIMAEKQVHRKGDSGTER